jgi:hypothetical protein
MKTSPLMASMFVTILGGCAGSKDAETARHPHAPELTDGTTPTEFQKRRLVGHYSTLDGGSGFILDRGTSPFLAKLDGGKAMPLEESHGPYQTKEYRSADHSIWVRIGEDGDVLLFQGPNQHEGARIVRDADANSLRSP